MPGDEPRTTWGIGEYPLMAERLRGVAERAVDRVSMSADDRVLDVACGTGNAALLAAARGAWAVGVDIEPRLLAVARARALAGGLAVQWRVGDAAALPVPDEDVTVVLSAFGVMYASDQAAAARELARVSAPGARLALASWVPGGFMAAMGGTLAPFLPPPPAGAPPPARWGEERGLAELLGPTGIVLDDVSGEHVGLEFADRQDAVRFLVRTAGHLLAERPRLERDGRWDSVRAALDALVEQHDQGEGEGVSLRLDYLLAVGRARGP